MTRRALVLSTGGAFGAFEVGVLEELIVRRGLDFEILCGISAGTLNASVLAQAQFYSTDPTQSLLSLQDAFHSLRTLWLDRITGSESIFCSRLLGLAGIAVGADSVYDVTPLENKIRELANPIRIAQSGRRLRIQYTVLETGELVTVTESGQDIVKGILASASIPVFFPPVRLNGQHLVDGGVRQMTPLATAFDAEPPPDIIYVVYAQPTTLAPVSYIDSGTGFGVGAMAYLMRTIAILLNQIDLTDIAVALKINELKRHWEALRPQLPADNEAVRAIDAVLGPKRYAKIVEIRPSRQLSGDGLNFLPSEIRANYEYGRESAVMLPAEDTLEDSFRLAS
jgi:NTE family protein